MAHGHSQKARARSHTYGFNSMVTCVMLLSAVVQAQADDGLSLGELFQEVPTDPSSVFVILLLLSSLVLVLWTGRPKGGGGGGK